MTLDHIDDFKNEYVLANNSHEEHDPVITIPKNRAYCTRHDTIMQDCDKTTDDKLYYEKDGRFMWVIEKIGDMQPKTFYLFHDAYSITLTQE